MRDYLLQGGFYSGLVESEVDLTGTRAGIPAAMAGSAGRGWSRLVYVLTRPAWIAEAGTRVNQFLRARRRGRATGYEAVRAARMVSADFANIGASRGWRMYAVTVPFLNAAIQGFDQLYQIVRFRSRPDRSSPLWGRERRRHVAKTLASGLLLSVWACVAWQHNQQRDGRRDAYTNQTDYEKASWVTLHDVEPGTDLQVPVPFQIGALFVKLPEVALDIAFGSSTQAGPKFIWSLVHGNLAVGWIPAVAQPFVAVYTNRNFFGEPVMPKPQDAQRDRPCPRPTTRNSTTCGPGLGAWAGTVGHAPPHGPRDFHRSTPLPYREAGAAMGVRLGQLPKSPGTGRWCTATAWRCTRRPGSHPAYFREPRIGPQPWGCLPELSMDARDLPDWPDIQRPRCWSQRWSQRATLRSVLSCQPALKGVSVVYCHWHSCQCMVGYPKQLARLSLLSQDSSTTSAVRSSFPLGGFANSVRLHAG